MIIAPAASPMAPVSLTPSVSMPGTPLPSPLGLAPSTSPRCSLIPLFASPSFSIKYVALVYVIDDGLDLSLLDSNWHDGENGVYCILVVQTAFGFPAFNQSNDLVGFYQYDDSTTYLGFVSAQLYEGKIDGQIKELQEQFQKHKAKGSSFVLRYVTITTRITTSPHWPHDHH
jgi:hypothetical protein